MSVTTTTQKHPADTLTRANAGHASAMSYTINRYNRADMARTVVEAATLGMPLAVAYLRISDDFEDLRLGVARQRLDVAELAGRLGARLLVIFEDNDTSGDKERDDDTAWAQMWDVVREYGPQYILGYYADRLGRRLGDAERLEEYCRQNGTVVHTVREGDVFADAMWPVRAGIAKAEIVKMRQRLKRSQDAREADGRDTGGGARPYGYAADRMTLIPGEVETIKRIAQWIIDGESGVRIARTLNAEGVRTTISDRWVAATVKSVARRPDMSNPVEAEIAQRINEHGETAKSVTRDLNRTCVQRRLRVDEQCDRCADRRPEDCERRVRNTRPSLWSSFMVRSIMSRPRIVGRREHNGQLVRAAWPAILDDDTYAAVGRRLAATSGKAAAQDGKKAPGAPTETLLGGMILCGHCLSPMVGQHAGGGRPVYRCVGAVEDGRRVAGPHVGRQRAALDTYMTAQVLEVLDATDVQAELDAIDARADDIEARMVALQAEIAHADRELRGHNLAPAVWRETRGAWVAELRELTQARDSAYAELAATRELRSARARWDSWTTAERRAAIRSVFEMIIIHPALSRGAAARVVRVGEVELLPAKRATTEVAA